MSANNSLAALSSKQTNHLCLCSKIPAQVHEVVLSHLLSGGLVLSVTPSGGANVPQVQSSSPTHLIYAHQGRMFLRLLCGPLLGPDVKAAALAPVSREQEFASMLKKSLIDLRTPSIASKKDVNQYFEHNKGLLASLFSPTWLPQASLLACIESVCSPLLLGESQQ